MSQQHDIAVTLPADVQQVDQTGYVWTFPDGADEPDQVQPGALTVAGDPVEPFLARVVNITPRATDRQIVHLDVVGVPELADG